MNCSISACQSCCCVSVYRCYCRCKYWPTVGSLEHGWCLLQYWSLLLSCSSKNKALTFGSRLGFAVSLSNMASRARAAEAGPDAAAAAPGSALPKIPPFESDDGLFPAWLYTAENLVAERHPPTVPAARRARKMSKRDSRPSRPRPVSVTRRRLPSHVRCQSRDMY